MGIFSTKKSNTADYNMEYNLYKQGGGIILGQGTTWMSNDIYMILPITLAGQAVQFGFDKNEANNYFRGLMKTGLMFDINYALAYYDMIITAAYEAKKKEGV